MGTILKHKPGILLLLLSGLWSGAAGAQQTLPDCPLFVSAAAPAYCSVEPIAPPPASSEVVPLAWDPDAGLRLLSRRPLFGAADIALVTRHHSERAPPEPGDYRLQAWREDGDPLRPGAIQAAYDVPFFDGLNLSNSSAVSETDGNGDPDARSLNSRFDIAYEDYGITFKMNPDAAINWGELAGSASRRFGVDNQISTTLARDLTLTLSSGYSAQVYPGNPLADSSTGRHRIAVAQHFASGYRLGLSAQRRSEYSYAQERDLNILGLMIGVPLGEDVSLTANHEWGLSEKHDLSAGNALPLAGQQQSLDLQLHWTPALLARRAMTLMAGYTVSQDATAGVADPYLTQARLNLAMRF